MSGRWGISPMGETAKRPLREPGSRLVWMSVRVLTRSQRQ
jgi:hypothetical protein